MAPPDDGTYAPRSPDLSFLSSSEAEQKPPNVQAPTSHAFPAHQYHPHPHSNQAALGIGPGSPSPAAGPPHNSSPPSHLQHLGWKPTNSDQPPPPHSQVYDYHPAHGHQQQHQPQLKHHHLDHQPPPPASNYSHFPAYSSHGHPHIPQHHSDQQPPSQPFYPPYPSHTSPENHPNAPPAYYPHPSYADPSQPPYQLQHQQNFPGAPYPTVTAPGAVADPAPRTTMPPRKPPQPVKEPEIMESPVRTKFPTARIKRIMQADEEVGKVAQQTPIAVGKALELFMVQLVSKSAEVAKEKNSKRITAAMLKQAVESANEWDFLEEIVGKVGEEKEGAKAGRAKAESDTDEDFDAGEVKKKGRGGRKKKAVA